MGRSGQTLAAGVHIVRKPLASGVIRWFIYAWRGGPCIRKVDRPTKPQITEDDIKALADVFEQSKPANRDTIRGLVAAYRDPQNTEWTRLADSTRALWGDCLDAILTKWAETPLRMWNDPRMVAKVMLWRDGMSATPRKADNHISTLYRLLEYGRLRARVRVNVASGIPTLYRGGDRAAIIWTDQNFADFLAKAKTPVADAVRLAAFTGLRRADLVGLTWAEVGEWAIRRTAAKKSAGKRRNVVMPIIPGLGELLDDLRTRRRKKGVETVLVTGFGTPWTSDGLNSSFYETRKKCIGKDKLPLLVHTDDDGKQHALRMHDLRGTFATKLMTIPGERLTDREISEVIGWSVEQVAEIRRKYVDDAAIVVALGKRLANIGVNQSVNQRGKG